LICGIGLLVACTQEQPSRTVTEFVEDPILLEAVMLRCAQDRSGMRYESNCINARAAVSRIQAKEEAAEKADLDASFERKRRALRRTQEVVAETKRRAAEAERLRNEAAYLAQFGELPPAAEQLDADANGAVGNAPEVVIADVETDTELPTNFGDVEPASDGGNAPMAITDPEPGD
jgi:hypothetical protein